MIEIRSYRRVFDLERRIYSLEGMRLNPTGVPVRGIVYLLAAVVTMLALAVLPALGPLIRAVPWYLRDLAAPGVLAAVLAVVRIDGRSFHVAASAIVRHRLRARTVSHLTRASSGGTVWRPAPIAMLPDGSEGRFRRLRYRGPGAVLVLRDHRREGLTERDRAGIRNGRRRTLRLRSSSQPREAGQRRTVIVVAAGAGLDVLADRPQA
ncbi:MAG TPA: hypothetical protein VGD00_09500 [Solirubrobacteraceae bacterium]